MHEAPPHNSRQSFGRRRIAASSLMLLGGPAVAYLLFVGSLTRHRPGNEPGAIYALQTLHAGQTRFRREDLDHDGKPDFASLHELEGLEILEVRFGELHVRQGYSFEVWRSDAPGHPWWGKASPTVLGTTGDRYFYVNREGAIYFSRSDLPLPLDETSDEVALLGS